MHPLGLRPVDRQPKPCCLLVEHAVSPSRPESSRRASSWVIMAVNVAPVYEFTTPASAVTWPFSKTLASRLHGLESRAPRTIERVHWFDLLLNEELRKTNQSSILRTIVHRRLCWFGHVLRRRDDRPTRVISQFNPPFAN